MKLFRSLLIAPAVLGLLAPMSAATANEINLNDVTNYSSKRAVRTSVLTNLMLLKKLQ